MTNIGFIKLMVRTLFFSAFLYNAVIYYNYRTVIADAAPLRYKVIDHKPCGNPPPQGRIPSKGVAHSLPDFYDITILFGDKTKSIKINRKEFEDFKVAVYVDIYYSALTDSVFLERDLSMYRITTIFFFMMFILAILPSKFYRIKITFNRKK